MKNPDCFVYFVIVLPDTAISHILGIFLFLFCAALFFYILGSRYHDIFFPLFVPSFPPAYGFVLGIFSWVII